MNNEMRTHTHFRIKSNIVVNYKLSILICTLHSRNSQLNNLLQTLKDQIQTKPVQVLWIGDNKSMKVGEKRNHLLDLAKGEWISFVDDDDIISKDYIDSILTAINGISDSKTVITFYGQQATDGKPDCDFRYNVDYGRNYKTDIDGVRWKVMIPDHLCVWRKDRVKKRFPNKNISEDHDWAKEMAMTYGADNQRHIEKYLYHYIYDEENSETR